MELRLAERISSVDRKNGIVDCRRVWGRRDIKRRNSKDGFG